MSPGIKNTPDISYARKIRKIRSELKKNLKSKKITLDVLLSGENQLGKYLGNLKVSEIILSLPGYGSVRTAAVLKKLKISSCKRLKGLGRSQKNSFEVFFNIKI